MLRRKIAIKTKSEEDTIGMIERREKVKRGIFAKLAFKILNVVSDIYLFICNLASEAKKRRLLEVQIVELKAHQQSAAVATDSNMTKLVADVKDQLANADAELHKVKGQLNDERY